MTFLIRNPASLKQSALNWQPAALFLCLGSIYVLLRSGNIFEVDGAHRCLEVFRRQTLFFHANNHMLYPAIVLAWTRIAGILGFTLNGPFEYFSAVQIMNCLAAAGCLAILYGLIARIISSQRLALAVTVGYGFSRAFLRHATNPGEPMVGVFWSLLAVCLVASAIHSGSKIGILIAGFLFALSMASYQSTVLMAPAAVVMLIRGFSAPRETTFSHSHPWQRLGLFAGSALAGCAVIYGSAYRIERIRGLPAMLREFFALQGARVYLGGGLGSALNIPVGMVRNIFPVLLNYSGVRNLFAGPKSPLFGFLLLLLSLTLFLAACFVRLRQRWSSLSWCARTAALSASAGLFFTGIPLLIWDPNYDKLWLQPLACLAVLIALSVDKAPKNEWRSVSFFHGFAAIFLIGVLSSNSILAIYDHRHGTWGIPEAREVAEAVGAKDLVVGGWDNVSVLYADLWANDGRFFDFTSEAVLHGRGAVARLREAAAGTREAGGRVYFIGITDMSRTVWDSFQGSRCGVPYSDLELYRLHSAVLARFTNDGTQITFSQLDSAALK